MPNEVGNKIKKIRLSSNLSQKRFGSKLGISEKTVSAYETGKIIPSYKVLQSISEVYEVNILSVPTQHKAKIQDNLAKIEHMLNEMKQILSL